MERVCLDCGQPIKGRADKKFCDDYCRNSHNNSVKEKESPQIKKINNILKKNLKILKGLYPENNTRLNRTTLLRAGFEWNYHTHMYQTSRGNKYIFCYEYGYSILESDRILLVKEEDL